MNLYEQIMKWDWWDWTVHCAIFVGAVLIICHLVADFKDDEEHKKQFRKRFGKDYE